VNTLHIRFTRDDARLIGNRVGFYAVIHVAFLLIALFLAVGFALSFGFLQQSDLNILAVIWGFIFALFLFSFTAVVIVQSVAEIVFMLVFRRNKTTHD